MPSYKNHLSEEIVLVADGYTETLYAIKDILHLASEGGNLEKIEEMEIKLSKHVSDTNNALKRLNNLIDAMPNDSIGNVFLDNNLPLGI